MYKHTEWNRTVFDPRVNEKNKVFFLLPKKYFKCTIDAKSFAFFIGNYKVFYLSLTLERMNKIDF